MTLPNAKSEVYRIMDEIGFNAGNLLTAKESTLKVVTRMRDQMAIQTSQMIEEREEKIRKENNG